MKKLLLIALCAALPAVAGAQTQTVNTFQRAQLWNVDPGNAHPSPADLWAFESGGSGYYPLLQADFSSLAGRTVLGNGTFNIYFRDSYQDAYSVESIALRAINNGWDEGTATYNSFFATNGFGATINTQTVTYNGAPYWVSFVVPQAVLQGWLSAPSTSNGVALENLGGYSSNGHTDMIFKDTEALRANFVFETEAVVATPEPVSVVLLATGLVGLLGVSIRRRNSGA